MFIPTLRELKGKITQLQERWRGARRAIEQLRQEIAELRRQKRQLEREREQWEQQRERLERERERLREENDRLRRQWEEAQRAPKRPAAPFSRGTRKEHPKTPGRKPGTAYGRRYSKLPPSRWTKSFPYPCPGDVA